jgi:phosphatidylethanolamine-binding protein (PEBP) family uncharacterized protein
MGLVFRTVEPLLGWLMSNNKNHDAGLFTKAPAVSTQTLTPNILVSSPDCGASGSPLPKQYASAELGGSDKMVSLAWDAPRTAGGPVKEYLLVIEDPDAPMKEPIVHGIYFGIPATKTKVTPADFEVADLRKRSLKGGFFFGENRKNTVYVPPRPIKNHGPDRYIFSVIALNAKLDLAEPVEAGTGASKTQILGALDGKVIGWGQWVGTYENKW